MERSTESGGGCRQGSSTHAVRDCREFHHETIAIEAQYRLLILFADTVWCTSESCPRRSHTLYFARPEVSFATVSICESRDVQASVGYGTLQTLIKPRRTGNNITISSRRLISLLKANSGMDLKTYSRGEYRDRIRD